MTPFQQATADRYRAGASLRTIAAEDGVSVPAVILRLKRANCPRRAPGQPKLPVFVIINGYAEGGSWKAAAEAHGALTAQAAHLRAAKRGFSTKDARHVRLLSPAQREAYRIALDEQDKTHAEAIAIARGK